MNTDKQIVLSLEGVNKSAILSTMAAELFQNGLNPRIALITACAWVGACDHLDDVETFGEALLDGLMVTTIEIKDAPDQPVEEIDGEAIMQVLVACDYLVAGETTEFGPRMGQLLEMRTEAYLPPLASEGITRRFGYAPVKYSPLYKEAIHVLEANQYTIDEFMLGITKQVIALTGGADKDKEGYVIKGCEKMSPISAYISEFKGDRRERMYQASCHGPNGQSSDRSRALMNLVGVTMDYNVEEVTAVLKAEMADMVTMKSTQVRARLVSEAFTNPVEFIIKALDNKADPEQQTLCTKPYSFVKATQILMALHRGERPYLGMAAGKDAKCSGPQLGALMVGDQEIAAACGFSVDKVHDAYHRAIEECLKAGFYGLTREEIKTPFMGIFYGQGWAAFMDSEKCTPAIWEVIHGANEGLETIFGNEDRAKAFHKAVCASFGKKMMAVRNAIKAYGEQIEKKISHFMPDGCEVAMNYKQKVNVLGEAVDYETTLYDVFLNNNEESYKFINFQLKTKHTHFGDFARNGFVNMIQGTDALLARMIIANLGRAGATNVICVHDCFRVNMTEMGLLDDAIKLAYTDLFGGLVNEKTKDLPLGKDILGLYFEGANKALKAEVKPRMVSQFFTVGGKRRMTKIKGTSILSLVKQLGRTYYFDK